MTFDPEQARAIIAARAQQPAVPLATAAASLPTPPEPEIKKDIPMADQAETDLAAIQAKATADAIATLSARNTGVTASEHYKGREAIANAMINDPEMASKSAESIIALIQLSPAHGEAEKDLDARETDDARAMLAGIVAAHPAALGAALGADTPALSEEDRLLKATVDALAKFK